MRKVIIAFSCILLSIGSLSAQSETVTEISERSESYTYFVYQSMIRMLLQAEDEDFNMFIRDLEYIKVVLVEVSTESAGSILTPIESNLESEGYEEYISITKGDMSYRIFSIGKDMSRPSFVVSLVINGSPFLLEMKGPVDMKYMSSVKDMDFSKITDLMGNNFNFN